MLKILVADSANEEIINSYNLLNKFIKITYLPKILPENISKELVQDYSALLVKNKEVTSDTITKWRRQLPDKKLCITRIGSDTSHIAYEKALELSIPVMNIPGASKNIIADYVQSHLPKYGEKKLATVIGSGVIAKQLSKKLFQKDFSICMYSPHIGEKRLDARIRKESNIYSAVDGAEFIIILTPYINKDKAEAVNTILSKELLIPTEKLINRKILERASKNACIICPSRPWIIDIENIQECFNTNHSRSIFINCSPSDIEKLMYEFPHFTINPSNNIQIESSSKFLNANTRKAQNNQKIITNEAIRITSNYLKSKKLTNPIFQIQDWGAHDEN